MNEYNYEDDDYEDEMCECELDWRCSLHSHLPTPEDLIATAWSESQG